MCGFGAAYKGVHQDTPRGGRHLGRLIGLWEFTGLLGGFYGLWEFDEGVLEGNERGRRGETMCAWVRCLYEGEEGGKQCVCGSRCLDGTS